jgi:hypothetical protein
VTAEYVAKHAPRAGGYWVRYAPYDDSAYQSYSPAAAFEEGNTLIVEGPTTIDELEKILNEDPRAVHINPDGTVTVLQDPGHQSTLAMAAQQPIPNEGMAAQQPATTLLAGEFRAPEPEGETTVSDPDTHA